ncbi:MAG: M67 family metallopeptidase [Zoogloeaceae bacterium]|jgi:proteasome lid subunit RPN8/RPN11|nr:M67 family metallopeptidase [Zoogloeaceae bacterium]
MLKIPQSLYDALIAHARRDLPNEACGYLGGTAVGEERRVSSHFPLTNVDASPEHFGFDPAEQFAAMKTASAQGERLIVCYHSHPATPARPSEEDIRLAYDPNISYIIVSLAAAEPVVKAFRIRKGEVETESIEVSA